MRETSPSSQPRVTGTTQRGAIFRGRAGEDPSPVLTVGTTWESRRFAILGPPALNNAGTMAFHGVAEGRGVVDGIFTLGPAGITLLIRDGTTPEALPAPFTVDPIAEFSDVVAINDAGDVLCTGGPLFDNSDDASFDDIDGSPGVVLIRSGAPPLLVGFPGQRVELFEERLGRITELALGPELGSRPAVPTLGPDGTVVFFAIVNNGSGQAIFRVDPVTRSVFPLVRLGGLTADPTPIGGTYLSASSSPVLDTAGNIAFTARIQGGASSEILAWRTATGEQDGLAIGDAAPDPARGYLAGPAFFPPIQNDAGDVVFKAYVTRGPGASASTDTVTVSSRRWSGSASRLRSTGRRRSRTWSAIQASAIPAPSHSRASSPAAAAVSSSPAPEPSGRS